MGISSRTKKVKNKKYLEEAWSWSDIRRIYGFEVGDSTRMSQFGGLWTLIQFLEKGKIKPRLEALFGRKKARTLLQLMLGIIAGAKDMEDVERAGGDPVFKKYLDRPVVATQLTRDLGKFTRSELACFHEFVMSLSILEIVENCTSSKELTIDVDATAVRKYGDQEGVERGYIEKDKIEGCYQYLFFRLDEINTFLYGTIRGGSTHSQNDFCGYLEQFLPMFKSKWDIKLRADSGYFNLAAFDIAGQHNTTLYIKAPMQEYRKEFAAEQKDLVWHVDSATSEVSYASYNTKTNEGRTIREVYKRTDQSKNQLSLLPCYRYDCIVTSDLVSEDKEVYRFYNGRAKIENNIKELKYDYKLGHIVSQSFDTNDAITQTTMMAYILMTAFKRIALDKDHQRKQLSTLRWKMFNIPASALKGAGRVWYRLLNRFVTSDFYKAIIMRIGLSQAYILNPG